MPLSLTRLTPRKWLVLPLVLPFRPTGSPMPRTFTKRVKRISPNGDASITYHSLKREGYDSVLIPRQNGHEYVVYSSEQVKAVKPWGA